MKLWTVFYFTWLLSDVKAWTTSRLQRDSIPISYSLKFIPDIKADTFYGEVTILIEIGKSVKNITLNSKFLDINEITLDQAFGETAFILDPELELLHVFYNDQGYVDPGEHILNIKFKGSLIGWYGFSSFRRRYGGNYSFKEVLGTKFSPTHARETFPCYDEPYFKSIFNIRLVKPDDSWTALSNMEEIGHVETPEGTAVDFRSTIPMSTYLLAWFLMDFTYDENVYQGQDKNIPLRFFTRKEKASGRKEALRVTKRALQFFENYTGIPYPLSKLDSIEIPFYSSSGMEHWGLVTYRESAVIYNPPHYISKLQHSIDATALISHEISHMWFGNLVSHEWYNDLWLTEGFARFMQYKSAFDIVGAPFLNMLFQQDKASDLFERHCSHRIAIETAGYVRKLSDIGYKFGSTTYDQGAAILFMLEDVIGKDKFQEIVKKHLLGYRYKHATTGDFINTVQDVVPTINVKDFMLTYLFQKNLPVITVTDEEDYYILKQEPFCENQNSSIFRNRWTVPIKYITNENKTQVKAWFDRDMSNVTIARAENNSWIIVNHLNTGLFRTLYSRSIYSALREHFKELHKADRGFLIAETFQLASHQRLFCDIPLQLLGEMQNIGEVDFLNFEYVSRSFFEFSRTQNFDPSIIDILKSYFVRIFATLYHNISWLVAENESIDHRLLRQRVLESFCSDVMYFGCYEDVKNIINKNITIHDDIKDIFDEVNERMKKNETENEENLKIVDLLDSNEHEWVYEQNCSEWIRENLHGTEGTTTTIYSTTQILN